MTLEQLRIFIAVAEREHLTQAADSLALTPSAVSASLRALEQSYNTPLFNRIGRRIELNESGRLFLVAARATLAAARNAELILAELTGLQRGTLAMYASQTIASYWLPPLLMQFRQLYPMITLDLTIGNSSSVAQAVLQGTADLGFVEGCIKEPELVITKVAEDNIVLVTGAGHPWADGRTIDAPALLSAEWIMREQGSGTRSALESRLAAMGVDAGKLNIALTLPSNEAVRSAVVAGRYVTVVSELVVASHLQTGLLSKANFTLPPRRFSMLHHEQRNSSKAAQAFKHVLQLSPSFTLG